MPTILIADDDPSSRKLLRTVLQAEGHTLVIAEHGESALKLFSECPPDLVLLDVMMPKLSGIEVCQFMKSNQGNRLIPVILVTALSAREDRVSGIEAGADDFLTKPIDSIELLARVRSLLSLKAHTDELERADSVLMTMARTIESRDPYTESHCERLSHFVGQLGGQIGLPDEQITALVRAGVVHDIGKVAIPDSILLKNGSLTPQEWDVVHRHPLIGEQICAPLRSFRTLLPIIRHHHEKLNGTGYPDHIKGENIPVGARVLQIVDVYDALTTQRPYKAALSTSEALRIMTQEVEKGWWDSNIFTSFEKTLTVNRTRQETAFAFGGGTG